MRLVQQQLPSSFGRYQVRDMNSHGQPVILLIGGRANFNRVEEIILADWNSIDSFTSDFYTSTCATIHEFKSKEDLDKLYPEYII